MKLIDIPENKIYTDGKMLFERVGDSIHEAKRLENLDRENYYWHTVSSIKKLNSDVFEYIHIDCICHDKTITISKGDIEITMTKGQFEEIYDKYVAPF